MELSCDNCEAIWPSIPYRIFHRIEYYTPVPGGKDVSLELTLCDWCADHFVEIMNRTHDAAKMRDAEEIEQIIESNRRKEYLGLGQEKPSIPEITKGRIERSDIGEFGHLFTSREENGTKVGTITTVLFPDREGSAYIGIKVLEGNVSFNRYPSSVLLKSHPHLMWDDAELFTIETERQRVGTVGISLARIAGKLYMSVVATGKVRFTNLSE